MVGVEVEPPAAAAAAAGLSPRRLGPRSPSAKRSWPSGCGRPAAPPPSAAAGGGLNGADGGARVLICTADEVVAAPTAVSPQAQDGSLLDQQGLDKAAAPAAVSAVSQNSTPPQQKGLDKVEASLAAAQNGTPPQQGPNKVDEAVVPAAVLPVVFNGVIRSALPELSGDREEENGEAQLLGDAGMPPLDGQEGNRLVEVVSPAMAVPDSCGIVGSGSSAQNGGERCGLLVAEVEMGRGEEVGGVVVTADGNRAGGGELERKQNGVAGAGTKRCLTSTVKPPPKKRAGEAVCKLPPDTRKTAATTTDNGVLEVSPIRTFPSYGRPAFTTTCSVGEEGLPLEATPVTNGDASVQIPVSGGAASPTLVLEVSNEKMEGKRMVDGHSKAHSRVQILDGFVGIEQDGNLQPNADAKSTPKNSSDEKMKGSISQLEGNQVAQVVVDGTMKEIEGSLHRSTLKTHLSDPIHAKTKGKRLESDKMNVLLGNTGRKMQSKTLSTKKKVVCSNVNIKKNKSACKLNKFGKHVATNGIEASDDMDLIPEQLIVQALMAPDQCPWTRGKKRNASASKSLAPRSKLDGKDITPRKLLTGKAASHESINDETMEDNDDSNLEDDDNSKALVMCGEKREICVMVLPSVPSGSHHKQLGDHGLDPRSKVRKMLQLFQVAYRKFTKLLEQGNRNLARLDYEAINSLKENPIYNKPGPIVGNIPGVEVGDEFHFRVELSMVGLHRPYQGGIDTSKVNGVPVAISIVASGGYPDELSSSGELIYTGSGGKAGGNKQGDDQKLERGNLALKNCIDTRTLVRVIHGFKGQSRSEAGPSKGKQTSTYIYDGLYQVVECWQEGLKGEMVFKYRLQRIAGQPELALHAVKVTRKSKVRPGQVLDENGKEKVKDCYCGASDCCGRLY
nr:unnamed protein product [Digitaria exilis]